MLSDLDLSTILFLDIETVPIEQNYNQLPENFKKLWDRKSRLIKDHEEETPDVTYSKAGIYAEFGKIICISTGFFYNRTFRIKSYYSDNEKELLIEFADMLNKHFNRAENMLCAHNGKEFDFPYIARRMVVHNVELPVILDVAGKKPWEVKHLDTMELWKFGDRKNYTSLELLTAIFNIPSPKQDIDGSEVGRVYWEEKDLERIVTYCQRDVLAIAQIMLHFQRKPILDESEIIVV